MKQSHEHDRGRPDRCGERHVDEDDPPRKLRLPLQLADGGLRQRRARRPRARHGTGGVSARDEPRGSRARTGARGRRARPPARGPTSRCRAPRGGRRRGRPNAGRRPSRRCRSRREPGRPPRGRGLLAATPPGRARRRPESSASRSTISAPARATSASVKCTTTAIGSRSVAITTRPMGAWTSVTRKVARATRWTKREATRRDASHVRNVSVIGIAPKTRFPNSMKPW